jgi:hypothetical protein
MLLPERIASISSKEDLADFVKLLLDDLRNNRDGWENQTLERYLFAMEDWIRDMDGYYINTGQQVPLVPSWKTIGDILYAAKIYE